MKLLHHSILIKKSNFQVFALTYSVESLVPIMMTQAYASLWKAKSAGRFKLFNSSV